MPPSAQSTLSTRPCSSSTMARALMSGAMPKVSTRRCLVSGCWLSASWLLSRSHMSERVAGGRPSLQLSSTSWPRSVASRKVGIMRALLLCGRIIAPGCRQGEARRPGGPLLPPLPGVIHRAPRVLREKRLMAGTHLALSDPATCGNTVKFFGFAFTALLPLINPFGDALVLLGLVGKAPASVYRELAKGIAISTTLFLLAVELVGAASLRFSGISLPVMQVAGGLVLAAMGWQLLNQEPQGSKSEAAGQQPAVTPTFDSLKEKIFYPFTFPITAGPGCIVVMVTLSAHASGKGVFPDVWAHAGIVLAVLALGIPVYLCYAYAPAITARVSPETANGILRVIAFVLLCIGVQIVWNGLETDRTTLIRESRSPAAATQ